MWPRFGNCWDFCSIFEKSTNHRQKEHKSFVKRTWFFNDGGATNSMRALTKLLIMQLTLSNHQFPIHSVRKPGLSGAFIFTVGFLLLCDKMNWWWYYFSSFCLFAYSVANCFPKRVNFDIIDSDLDSEIWWRKMLLSGSLFFRGSDFCVSCGYKNLSNNHDNSDDFSSAADSPEVPNPSFTQIDPHEVLWKRYLI